jgi:hypothetical protein
MVGKGIWGKVERKGDVIGIDGDGGRDGDGDREWEREREREWVLKVFLFNLCLKSYMYRYPVSSMTTYTSLLKKSTIEV